MSNCGRNRRWIETNWICTSSGPILISIGPGCFWGSGICLCGHRLAVEDFNPGKINPRRNHRSEFRGKPLSWGQKGA